MGNRRLFDKLLNDFIAGNSGTVEEIRQLLEKGDTASAQSRVHTLKGVAGNLSALEVFTAAQELEASIRQNDYQGQISLLVKLDRALKPILARMAVTQPGISLPNNG